jgi:Heterokaryon incompatibility protein (HET)
MASARQDTLNYKPLTAGSDLRLLRSWPALSRYPNPPIWCQLKHFSWTDSPRYVSLSYIWGPAEYDTIASTKEERPRTYSIFPNGKEFPVLPNLHDGLLQLRTNSQSITTEDGSLVDHFWVDAICTDESNYAEKAAQVN